MLCEGDGCESTEGSASGGQCAAATSSPAMKLVAMRCIASHASGPDIGFPFSLLVSSLLMRGHSRFMLHVSLHGRWRSQPCVQKLKMLKGSVSSVKMFSLLAAFAIPDGIGAMPTFVSASDSSPCSSSTTPDFRLILSIRRTLLILKM